MRGCFLLATTATMLCASPCWSQTAPATQEELLARFDQAAQAATADWLKKKQVAAETKQFIDALGKLHPTDSKFPHLQALEKRLGVETEEALAAEDKALELNQKASHAYGALGRSRPPVKPGAEMLSTAQGPSHQHTIAPATISNSAQTIPTEEPCSLENVAEMTVFNPARCLKAASGVSQGSISLFNRVVDKQGVNASLTISGSGTKASLKFADTFTFRSHHPERPDYYQRKWTLGYNIGIQSTNVTGSDGRLAGLAESNKVRSLTDLDRLDEKVSLTAGISFNKFPEVTLNPFVAGVTPIVESARAACQQSYPVQEHAARCSGPQLIEWINNNKKHLEALTSFYWGGAQDVAEWGVGLQGEVARPVFKYLPFDFIEVPDPLKPGSTKSVIDLTRLPDGFPDDPISKPKVPFTLTAYAFRHVPFVKSWIEGLTVIGSGTWKRSYEISKSRRDVIVCPVEDGAPFETNEACRTINVAAPGGVSEYLLSGELRTKFGRFWIFPSVGVAPKFTWELRRDRHSLDVPVYVSADKDGKLNGGLRIKYDFGGQDLFEVDRKDEVLLSIFFGTNFDFNVSP